MECFYTRIQRFCSRMSRCGARSSCSYGGMGCISARIHCFYAGLGGLGGVARALFSLPIQLPVGRALVERGLEPLPMQWRLAVAHQVVDVVQQASAWAK